MELYIYIMFRRKWKEVIILKILRRKKKGVPVVDPTRGGYVFREVCCSRWNVSIT